ncbi:MAG: ABC transporter permease subunit [Oscillospiraceae bacterium]|nr:ABC transporter permease subunit [Oscillospiraceae bacterium]
MRKGRLFYNVLFYVCLVASCAPLIMLIILTVSTFWPYPSLLPEVISTDYYSHVFAGNRQTLMAFVTSILLAFFVAMLSLAIAVPAGKAIACYDFLGKRFVKMLVLVPLIVPSVAVITGIHISMIKLGLTGTFFGVALVQTLFALPYAIRIMTNVFEIIGKELEQQAAVLGAGPAAIFLRVTLPRIMPGILSAGVLGFTVSIAQYITTFMIGGGRIITLTVLIIPHIQSGQHHIAAVYSTVLILAALLSLYLTEKTVRRYYNVDNLVYI